MNTNTQQKAKLHVILRKEDINQELLANKVALVLDILCATSSICTALAHQISRIIPALDGNDAIAIAQSHPEQNYLLAGEFNAETLQGFSSATPLSIVNHIGYKKTLIYSTTNGTIALRHSQAAEAVYAVSLLNAKAVIEHVLQQHPNRTVILVCSGSGGRFNMEDFYGAGYLISLLPKQRFDLTDASIAAQQYYQAVDTLECLRLSRVGKRLIQKGLEKELEFIAQKDIYSVIPELIQGEIRDAQSR